MSSDRVYRCRQIGCTDIMRHELPSARARLTRAPAAPPCRQRSTALPRMRLGGSSPQKPNRQKHAGKVGTPYLTFILWYMVCLPDVHLMDKSADEATNSPDKRKRRKLKQFPASTPSFPRQPVLSCRVSTTVSNPKCACTTKRAGPTPLNPLEDQKRPHALAKWSTL